MNSALRKVLLGVAVIVFVAFIWHRASTPDAPQDPLLREVQWKLGPVEKLWNRVRPHLPPRWQMQFPASEEPDWLSATEWLSRHANDPEVARSIVRTWPRWNPEARMFWLSWIEDRELKLSREYQPLIHAEIARNSRESYRLLLPLARHQPLPPSDVDFLIHYFENQFLDLDPSEQIHLLSQLATFDSLPREVLMALTTLPQGPYPEVPLIARVVCAQLAPAEFPLNANAEAQFRRLSPEKQSLVLTHLAAPEFRQKGTPSWSLARLADLVCFHRTNGTTNEQNLKRLFIRLEETGNSAGPLAFDVASWITLEDSKIRDPAARALTQLSPPTPELLTVLLPHLTFDSATATLLTWLAAHPAQSQAAEPVIVRLCQGHAPRQTDSATPHRSGILDPNQARRGSLGMGRPEGLQLRCWPELPLMLLPAWPGYRSLSNELAASGLQTNQFQFHRTLHDRLPKVTFRELAEHCLAEIRAARNTPTNHPASPNGSDR